MINRKWLRILTVIPDYETSVADIIIERPNGRGGSFEKRRYFLHKDSASFKRLERCVNNARDEGRVRVVKGQIEIADEPWSERIARYA